jgi:hypothetical protein
MLVNNLPTKGLAILSGGTCKENSVDFIIPVFVFPECLTEKGVSDFGGL